MRVKLKGLASATKKLANGTKITYWYAWRGGPRLEGQPGTPEFMASYNRAVATRCAAPGKFASIISKYRSSPAYLNLAQSTRSVYAIYLKRIEAEFGDAPIAAFNDRKMRGDIIAWRDKAASTPRAADFAISVMTRVLGFALDRGLVDVNVAERIDRLYHADRSEIVWGEAELSKLLASASASIQAAVVMALWTAQRQGDLLALPWSAYDGERITLRQSKSRRSGRPGRLLVIPVAKPLRALLDGLRAQNAARTTPTATILSTSFGRPWTSDGFKASWRKTLERAGLVDADLHFHDLRGSAITRLSLAGCTVPEIATISGHALTSVQSILDRYLARDPRLAEAAIMKREANELRTESANRLQTEPVCSASD